MRELSLVELELIVGGYDSGGGGGDYYDGSGESYGNSSFTYDGSENGTATIAAGDEQGITDSFTTAGIAIEDIPIKIEAGPVTISFKVKPPKSLRKK